jgi:hypothetical protein
MSKHWNALRLLGVYFYIQGAICVLSGLWLAYLTYDYMYLYDWKGDDSFGPGVAVLVCLVGTVYLLPFGLVSLLAGNRLCLGSRFHLHASHKYLGSALGLSALVERRRRHTCVLDIEQTG